jgi:FkbM family methyltransferase
MSEAIDTRALFEMESILHSLVANDTTILDALSQMLSIVQQVQARSEQSLDTLTAEIRELRGGLRALNLAVVESNAGTPKAKQAYVRISDEFAVQNPEIGLLEYLYSFLSDTNAIDVGAHVGRVAERLLKTGYTVRAFEPHLPSFKALLQKLGANKKFHAFNFAIGPADGTMDFHIASDLSGVSKWDPTLYNSLIERPLLQDLQFTQTVPVQVRSLESLRRTGEIPDGVGLLKIDTEGFDLEVLRGMGEARFSVVMAEFWDSAHPFGSVAKSGLADLVMEMKSKSYDWHIVIYHLDENTSYYCNREQTVPTSWGNVIFFQDQIVFAKALRWCEEVLAPTLHR